MSGKDQPPGDDIITGLRREIEDLEKKLEHYRMRTHLRNNAVAEVSNAIFRLDSFQSTAKMIFQAYKRATGARAGYVALLTPDGKENSIVYLDAGGLPCTVDPALPMPIRGLRAEAYKSRQPVIDNNFKDSKWMHFMPGGHVVLNAVMFAPMVIGGEAKGLIGLANKPGGFSDEDAEIASSYAGIAVIAMQSSHMIESIKKTNEELKSAYQDMRFFKDLIVHDLNNALQAISSAVDLWKLKLAKGLPASGMKETLDIISENIIRGAELIKNSQKIERLMDPRLAIEPQDIVKYIRDSASLLKRRFSSKQIEIDLDLEDDSINAYGIDLVRDAIDNILINAVRHNASATIKIHVTAKQVEADGKQFVRIEFVDNGVGIEDGRKETIFDRSTQEKRGKEGLGIGLSVVKRIITRCGGKIWVEDAVKGEHSQGSKFIVILPFGPDVNSPRHDGQ
nr:GAF domain-containing sensor histidine kinase [Candidatus Sigynarchaeum springense]